MESITYSKPGFYTFPFSSPVIKDSVRLEKGETTAEGGLMSNLKYFGVTTQNDGVVTCDSIQYYVHLVTSKRIWLMTSVGNGVSYYDISVPSTLEVQIYSKAWEGGATNTDGETDEASIEYQDLKVIVDAGFNLKCVDKYHRDYLGYGEIRADYSIVNGLIPSREVAKKIARREIFKTGKTAREVTENLPPNFNIIPGSTIRGKISSLFIDKNARVEKVRIAGNDTYEVSYNILDRES